MLELEENLRDNIVCDDNMMTEHYMCIHANEVIPL